MCTGTINRETLETKVNVSINLSEPGENKIDTGVGFFDHMLNLLAFRAGITLTAICKGDLYVDDHHSIEDIGIAMGMAFKEAIGDKKGIAIYGNATIPMDESLASCHLDISGRGFLVFNATMPSAIVGSFSTEMTEEFFRAFALQAGITLHINLHYGKNTHHIIEGIFKAVGVALNQGIKKTGEAIPSTKGVL